MGESEGTFIKQVVQLMHWQSVTLNAVFEGSWQKRMKHKMELRIGIVSQELREKKMCWENLSLREGNGERNFLSTIPALFHLYLPSRTTSDVLIQSLTHSPPPTMSLITFFLLCNIIRVNIHTHIHSFTHLLLHPESTEECINNLSPVHISCNFMQSGYRHTEKDIHSHSNVSLCWFVVSNSSIFTSGRVSSSHEVNFPFVIESTYHCKKESAVLQVWNQNNRSREKESWCLSLTKYEKRERGKNMKWLDESMELNGQNVFTDLPPSSACFTVWFVSSF